jgi:hypothetical protein
MWVGAIALPGAGTGLDVIARNALASATVSGATAATAGGVIVGTSSKLAVVGSLTLLLGGGVWFAATRGDDAPRAAKEHAGLDAASGKPNTPELAGSASARSEPVTAPDPAAGALVGTGRVVDEDGRPVADAEVISTWAGRETGRARSGADGRFEVVLGRPSPQQRIGVLEVLSGGRGALRDVYGGPSVELRRDYGRITLKALHELTVRVVRQGRPVEGATVAVGDGRSAHRPLRAGTTGAQGTARFDSVLGTTTGVWAVAAGTGRAYRPVALPPAGVVEVELPDDRTATVHVKHGVTGAPVEGAEVSFGDGGALLQPHGPGLLPPMPELRTNAKGAVVVSGLPPGHLMILSKAPGMAMRNTGMMVERVELDPDASGATIELWPSRTVRFPIAETGAGAPPEGTRQVLQRYQPLSGYDEGEARARIEGGYLLLESFPPGHDWGHVVSEDGRWASWTVPFDTDEGKPVEFRRIHDLRVRLLFRDGPPAAGEYLRASVQPRGHHAPATTDAEGRITFRRCIGETVTVLWTPVASGFGMPLGSASLLADPGEVIYTIDRPVEIALRVRVAGQPRLPPELQVYVPDLDPSGRGGTRQVVGREIREDLEAAELAFRWLPMPDGSAPRVTVRSDGLPEGSATPQRDAAGIWRAEVDLQHGATVRGRVVPPKEGGYVVELQVWHPQHKMWLGAPGASSSQGSGAAVDGVHTFGGLPPDRYRLWAHMTGTATDPIDLRAGETVELVLDLASTVLVTGRVEVPPGESPAYAAIQVHERDEGPVSRLNPVIPAADGTFKLRALRGERLLLAASHPLLRLAHDPVPCVVGTDAPVLRFVTGPHVVFHLEGSTLTTQDPDPGASPPWWSPVSVRFWKPDAPDAPGVTSHAIATNGRFRAGVPGPGTWAARIEQPGTAPIELGTVELGPGATDLGTLRPAPGATLTVRLRTGGKPLPANIVVRAERLGVGSYSVSNAQVVAGDPPSLTPPAVTLKGLGEGTFRVTAHVMLRKGTLAEARVESPGTGTLTVDLDLK